MLNLQIRRDEVNIRNQGRGAAFVSVNVIKLKRHTIWTNQLLLTPRASDTVTRKTAILTVRDVVRKIEQHISKGNTIKVSSKQASNCSCQTTSRSIACSIDAPTAQLQQRKWEPSLRRKTQNCQQLRLTQKRGPLYPLSFTIHVGLQSSKIPLLSTLAGSVGLSALLPRA